MSVSRRAGFVGAIFALGLLLSGALLDRKIFNYCIERTQYAFVSIPDPKRVSEGYVLVSPYIADNNYAAEGEVLLLDVSGRVSHRWRTRYQPLQALLQNNGHLFVTMTPPIDIAAYPSGGTTGLIEELDWNGNVLWSYRDPDMTHDFAVLPDGSIVYTRWSLAPMSFASQVRGGMRVATSSVWVNDLVVIDKEKHVLWQWHLADHVRAQDYVLGPLTPREDWSHVNSVVYTADNPMTHVPAYLISVRHISEVFLIDARSGAVIWRSPGGKFALQHDATLLSSGDIMVFDNGLYRMQSRPGLASRATEIDPRTDKINWEYTGGPTGLEQIQLASSIMGAAQRLPNGNTLITLSTQGRIIEVTSEKKIVWDYTNRYSNKDGRSRIVFKARKYSLTGTAWGVWLRNEIPRNDFVCQ